MSNKNTKLYKKITKQPTQFSTVTINRYWIPKPYIDAVNLTIQLFKHDVPFNKAVDQAAASFPNVNRNKLAEHTLKFIANDY